MGLSYKGRDIFDIWQQVYSICPELPDPTRAPQEPGGREALRDDRVDDVIRGGDRPHQDQGQGVLHRVQESAPIAPGTGIHRRLS